MNTPRRTVPPDNLRERSGSVDISALGIYKKRMQLMGGAPCPLRAMWDGKGVAVAPSSENAMTVTRCLFALQVGQLEEPS